MKKLRFICAIVLSIAIVSSFALAVDTTIGTNNSADGYTLTVPKEVKIADGDASVSFDIKADKGLAVQLLTYSIYYDANLWSVELTDFPGMISDEDKSDPENAYIMILSDSGEIADGEVIGKVTATPVAGANVDGSFITIADLSAMNKASEMTYDWIGVSNVIKIVKAATPVVNKYNVTFTGYESKNMTDVEENTEITLPAAPAVDKNKEFVGWSDGTTTYEAGAKYTVTGNVTFTAVINDITLPTPVVTKEGIISAEVEGKTYTDIFEGIYTLTPGKASLTKFGVKIPGKINPADVREFATSGTFEGEGTFVYRVALFGVMDKADIAATPFAE